MFQRVRSDETFLLRFRRNRDFITLRAYDFVFTIDPVIGTIGDQETRGGIGPGFQRLGLHTC